MRKRAIKSLMRKHISAQAQYPPIKLKLEELSSPDPNTRLRCIVNLELLNDSNLTSIFIKHLEKEHFQPIKIHCIEALQYMKSPKVIPALKRAVFDFERDVRGAAAEALAKQIGWKKTIAFIREKFSDPASVPAAFFYSHKTVEEQWRRRDWNTIRRQSLIDARRKGLVRMTDRRGRPFSVNGVPVFLGNLGNETAGLGRDGLLIINKDPAILNPKDRISVAWHEFGEIFSEDTAKAFEFDFMEKTGQFHDPLRRLAVEDMFYLIAKNWIKK